MNPHRLTKTILLGIPVVVDVVARGLHRLMESMEV